MNEWIDISVFISDDMVHWPGEPRVTISKISDLNKGNPANVSALSMSVHTGTHMDAPNHFIKDAVDISQIPLRVCIGPARVIPIKNKHSILPDELAMHNIRDNERILFRTHNSDHDWTRTPFNKEFVYIATEAAKYLADLNVALVGVDYLSVGGINNGRDVHKALLAAGIWIIEGLDLRNIIPGYYDLICLPLKILNSEGAPARAALKAL